MLPEAEKVLAAAGSRIAHAHTLQGEQSGSLNIRNIGSPDSLRLGALLSGLASALPLLEINTRAGEVEVLRESVATSDQLGIWPHPRVVALLSSIYPTSAASGKRPS